MESILVIVVTRAFELLSQTNRVDGTIKFFLRLSNVAYRAQGARLTRRDITCRTIVFISGHQV